MFIIAYLCDRKICNPCNPDCKHTFDPKHAINFIEPYKGSDADIANDSRFEPCIKKNSPYRVYFEKEI